MTVQAPARGALPLAPPEYSQQQMNALLRQLEIILNQLRNPGVLLCDTLTILNVPTSTTGLTSGAVWSDAGTLKIVP